MQNSPDSSGMTMGRLKKALAWHITNSGTFRSKEK